MGMALFGDTAPMTVLNFASIVKGYKRGRERLHYKDTPIHRVVPDFVIQMGDITTGDGTGGRSIFGERFNDEEFTLSHRSAGWAAMANHGKDVVFGKVVKGMETVKVIGEVESNPNTAVPKKKIKIIDCGINELEKKYDLQEDQLSLEADI